MVMITIPNRITTTGAIVIRPDPETNRGWLWLNGLSPLALLRLFRRVPIRRTIVSSLRIASILRAVANIEEGSWVGLRGRLGYAVGVVLFLSAGDGGLLFALGIGRARLIFYKLRSNDAFWYSPHRYRPAS